VNIHSFDVIQDKVVRDGKVAVLLSPGYGAGWYTWNQAHPELLFLPRVVEMVLNGTSHYEIEVYVQSLYEEDELYVGGAVDLVVKWVPQGEQFRIEEYDGAESLVLASQEKWITA
jgi:hypothetical protein